MEWWRIILLAIILLPWLVLAWAYIYAAFTMTPEEKKKVREAGHEYRRTHPVRNSRINPIYGGCYFPGMGGGL